MRGAGDQLSIGERIAFYRRRRGLTQAVLAEDHQLGGDDIPAIRDALMSFHRLSRVLFGPSAPARVETTKVAVLTERACNQRGARPPR
ncbi:hypothetical protein Kfla_6732 [Kribbella flavida DSM 17836]|uniref:Uncharacterized protein n=1 Tax=Kribbella flavida (strain DSM 17836 / JCM 10339 / NBRC 14399) TaxID=479435 RepID=D2Q123_KRIFD|nr:hypothetical protein [Kribbella flavida]ADB35724.1 hypothetical protein Kfla_6732 [Kribbella flavida DSM 17836]